MLKDDDIGILMWQCAFVHACRRRKGLSLSRPELKIIQQMQHHFRFDERPSQALVVQAMSLVTAFKARRRAASQGQGAPTERKARLEAAGKRLLSSQKRAAEDQRAAWRAGLHRDAYGIGPA